MPRIYLDNAATSWPKPEAVYAAVDAYQRELGAPAGRSPYAEASQVTRRVAAVRASCARLLGIRNPAQLIFAYSGTDALNLAIHGLLNDGDRVVTSAAEQNSVLRPLAELQERGRIQIARVECDPAGLVTPDALRAALDRPTRLVALTHASNVTGVVQPIGELARVCRSAGALLLVDAAQTVGHLPIDAHALDVDLLAASGHKGLFGPLGTGLLYIRPGLEAQLAPLRQGGTGSRSDSDRQPNALPDKYESGNLNVPGIVGLGAGVEYLLAAGAVSIERQLRERTAQLVAGLRAIRGVRLYGPADAGSGVGLVSLTIEGYDPQEVATALDAVHRVQVRPGLHCAPHMHRLLGTLERGGTVRLSLSPLTSSDQVDAAVAAIGELAAAV